MILRRVVLSGSVRSFVSPQVSCFKHGVFRFVSTRLNRMQTCRYSHLVPTLEFEQCKPSYSLKRREYGTQKGLEGAGCIEIECKDDVRVAEATTSDMLAKKSISGAEIVEIVVAELRRNGKLFILPVNDVAAMKAVTKAFVLLLDIGIQPEFIVDSCVSVPQLFVSLTQKGETSIQIIELIVDFCQLTYEDSIRIFATYSEELLSVGPEEVQKCMEVLDSYGFHDEKLREAICSCPALLFAHKSSNLAQNAENLFSHFSKNEFYSLLKSSPEILLGNTNETEDKIEYIYCYMLMEGEDFANCTNLAQISLEELIDRHEFLMKTGIYKTPDKKRPQLKMKNPKLKKILDSSEEQFVKRIAHVSIEEWHLFRELQNKRRLLESEGKIRPFERIKPSMRKQLDRKKKSAPLNDSETQRKSSKEPLFTVIGPPSENLSRGVLKVLLACGKGGEGNVSTEYFSGKSGEELHQTSYWIALRSGASQSSAALFSVHLKSNLGVMLNQSSSSSTKNYIDVCGEISECNSNAASQQRLLSGGTGSRQLKQEEPIAAATSVCAIVNDTPNMNTHDEAGCMASLFQTPPWTSMAILPPHNLAQQQGGVTREVVGSTNHPLAMRYSSFDGTAAAAAAAKDPMNPMNAPLYQVSIC
ncbi:unnamed protein product [Litomosoides sigmodontis]|uniref:Uncharacterized protein n=1 Tax=Litomosoides sigmodontis TaxID=42156 RepID=A0A3P6SDT4_LITSI|nr:unnamed protein product [Litomosoides sigmodontis]